ncbi:uncharacterized protein [Halyomorpha halys]|uniref:uncharacterized protein n=1 Tax=Halyomorpha halys TaxID=286706 RepID=UPI0006D4D88B|nr:uncharacterized protein LOC106678237 [Halyomorpha halys]
MDIVGKLPLEIGQHIFSHLYADDLGRCLRVSKQWRRIANDNIFWKYHCSKYGVCDKEESYSDNSSDLCHWALIWRSFAISLAYKWLSNNYRSIELCKNDYEGFASHGQQIVAFSKTFNNLDIYTIKKNTNRARLVMSIALCFPKEGPALLAMDSNYIAVAKYNVILLFKKNGDNYELKTAYAVILSTVIQTNRDFTDFVNHHITYGAAVEIDVVSNNILWLSDLEGSFVINLQTDHMTNVFTYECSRLQGEIYVTWSDDSVIIYNIEGTNETRLENIDGLEDVSANMTLLSLIRGFVPDTCLIEVYDLESGEEVLRKEMPTYTWIKMHPTEEVLFTLEASRDENVFRITSWFVRTGFLKWMFECNNNNFISFWELHVVCEKYLVVWPTASGDKKFYLFDFETGKCIYENSRPSGFVNFISDSLWISWPDNKSIAIRSYL